MNQLTDIAAKIEALPEDAILCVVPHEIRFAQADDLRGFDVDVPEIPHYPDVDVNDLKAIAAEIKRLTAPVDMLLFCPKCFEQHVDKAEPDVCQDCGHTQDEHGFKSGCGTHLMNCQCEGFAAWLNPPHKSHRCTECNHVWRPADVPTNGVQKLGTSGKADGSATPISLKRLTEENARLREGLEHYADKDSWERDRSRQFDLYSPNADGYDHARKILGDNDE